MIIRKIKRWWNECFGIFEPANTSSRDDRIEAFTDHYVSISDQGLNLFDFKPERPTGDMATNRYALDAYAIQLIAFSQAVVKTNKGEDDE